MQQNKYNLKIKNTKIIIKEDVTQAISTDQFHKIATEPITSSAKIGKATTENFIASIKLLIAISFSPLTKNLDSIIKTYENEIKESNKTLLESIPQNVLNSTNILTLASHPTKLILEKALDNFEKIPGIKDILTGKFLTDNIATQQISNIVSNSIKEGKSITSTLIKFAFKDIPEKMAPEYSTYRNNENEQLQKLLWKLESSVNLTKLNISNKPISIEDDYEKMLLLIINQIITMINNNSILTTYFTTDDEKEFLSCFLNIFGEGISDTNSMPWEKGKAISPSNSDVQVRFNLTSSRFKVNGSTIYVTIKKKNSILSNELDWERCFICLDDDTNQKTGDIPFSSFLTII